jgi:hypothetical protein
VKISDSSAKSNRVNANTTDGVASIFASMRNEIAMVDQLATLRTLAYLAIAVPSQRCRRSNGEMSATSLRLTCDHRKPIADRSQRNRDSGSPALRQAIGVSYSHESPVYTTFRCIKKHLPHFILD